MSLATCSAEWYAANDCDHAHCQQACDKPQPFLTADGRLLCSRCWVIDGVQSEMIPCRPETCED